MTLIAVVGLAGCEDARPADATPGSRVNAKKNSVATQNTGQLYGRWEGKEVCLELQPTGEFELSYVRRGPKVVIIGTAVQRRTGPGKIELTLQAKYIKRSKWISRCRKNVVSPKLLETYSVLGTEFRTDKPTVLRLRTLGGNKIELCGERCDTARSQTPRLIGEWRLAGLAFPSQATVHGKAGQMLRAKLGGRTSEIWIGRAASGFYNVYCDTVITYLRPGGFKVVLTPRVVSGKAGPAKSKAPLAVLGRTIAVGRPATFAVLRTKGGVKVCGTKGSCTALPRYVSAR